MPRAGRVGARGRTPNRRVGTSDAEGLTRTGVPRGGSVSLRTRPAWPRPVGPVGAVGPGVPSSAGEGDVGRAGGWQAALPPLIERPPPRVLLGLGRPRPPAATPRAPVGRRARPGALLRLPLAFPMWVVGRRGSPRRRAPSGRPGRTKGGASGAREQGCGGPAWTAWTRSTAARDPSPGRTRGLGNKR